MKSKNNIFNTVFEYFWALFLNGLFMILPITVTIAIFATTFKLLKSWLEPLQQYRPEFLKFIPHSEILLLIGIIILIGIILRILIVRSLLHTLEDIITKIPLIRPIYSGIKQLVKAFSLQDEISFKQVVLVEFPRKEIYSIGFLTSELPIELCPNPHVQFYNIFIPTTPNPTSGYFIIVPKKDIIHVDLTRQEAMALVISGGIIQPERFSREFKTEKINE